MAVRRKRLAPAAARSVSRHAEARGVVITSFVDDAGAEWRLYDRVRVATSATAAEFRFVAPGQQATRARYFVRADRVVFELRVDDRDWVGDVTDLRAHLLRRQLRRALRRGPVHVPR